MAVDQIRRFCETVPGKLDRARRRFGRDRARPISALAAEVEKERCPAHNKAALIGSCTNSPYADVKPAAPIAVQGLDAWLTAKVPFPVTPGSERVSSRDREAPIHETHLKKQGILPLVFSQSGDDDLVEPADRVSIRGLATLWPSQPVDAVIGKPGGRAVTVRCNHTMTDEHISWFRAGSALNALK